MGEETTTANGQTLNLTSHGSNAHHDSYTAPDTMLDSTYSSSQSTTYNVLGLALKILRGWQVVVAIRNILGTYILEEFPKHFLILSAQTADVYAVKTAQKEQVVRTWFQSLLREQSSWTSRATLMQRLKAAQLHRLASLMNTCRKRSRSYVSGAMMVRYIEKHYFA